MADNSTALKIAVKIIKLAEGCSLRAYPDPASELYKELSAHNLLHDYMNGTFELRDHLKDLSGAPWTISYGETKGIKEGMVWTQLEADTALQSRVEGFLLDVLKTSPKLATMAPEAIAAITSLAYNIGMGNYKTSTVAKKIAEGNIPAAADAILLWNKAKGVVMQGLINRRKTERDLFLSVKG